MVPSPIFSLPALGLPAAVLPFTQAQFLDVFRQYHAGVGVAQALILMVAVCGLSFAFWDSRAGGRVASSSLAIVWLWAGLAYGLVYLRPLFPGAVLLSALFVIQAGLFAWSGFDTPGLRFRFAGGALAAWLGALVILYSLTVYIALGFVFKHYYPSAPSFGVPTPVVLFTLGLLMWSNAPLKLWIIPTLYAALGTAAAVELAMPQDYLLAPAALLGLLLRRRIK